MALNNIPRINGAGSQQLQVIGKGFYGPSGEIELASFVCFRDEIVLPGKGGTFHANYSGSCCCSSPTLPGVGAGVTARSPNLSRPWCQFWGGDLTQPGVREASHTGEGAGRRPQPVGWVVWAPSHQAHKVALPASGDPDSRGWCPESQKGTFPRVITFDSLAVNTRLFFSFPIIELIYC